MDKIITLHGRNFKPFIPNSEICAAIDKIAAKLNKDFEGVSEEEAPILFCTLSGAIVFFSELLQRLDFPLEVKGAKFTSYEGTESTGVVKSETIIRGVKGRKVIIVEDIVDTGNTIVAMKKLLEELGASQVLICTLLLKPDVYKKDVKLDYVAMEIPNRFIVGFGLDYDELGRNIKDIYVLDE